MDYMYLCCNNVAVSSSLKFDISGRQLVLQRISNAAAQQRSSRIVAVPINIRMQIKGRLHYCSYMYLLGNHYGA